VNVLRLSLHPDGTAPRITNLPEWRAHLLARLEPLQAQGIYHQLTVGGRKDGKPGGLDANTSWLCTAACTERWSRRSPGGCCPTTPPGTPPHHPSPTKTSPRCCQNTWTCCWTPPPTTPSRGCAPGPRWPIVHVAASDLGTAHSVPPQRPHRRSGVLPIEPQHRGQRQRQLRLAAGPCALRPLPGLGLHDRAPAP
jgi:hypothetical protein